MTINFGRCLNFFATISMIQVLMGLDAETYAKDSIDNVSGLDNGEIVKRSTASIIASLLKTATKTGVSRDKITYEKKGGLAEAMQDFEDLKPRKVLERKTWIRGKVGDKTVIIRTRDGKTTLDIWELVKNPQSKLEFLTDVIEYKD